MKGPIAALLFLMLAIAVAGFAWWRGRVVIAFGTAVQQDDQSWIVTETKTVPFRPNDPKFGFGFVFHSPSHRKFRVRVDHLLPSRPEHYRTGEAKAFLAEDGRFKIEGNEVEVEGGSARISHSSPGDPLGWYEAHVFIDGGRKSIVRYQVCGD